MKKIKIILFIFLFSILFNSVYAEKVTFPPLDDMYTDEINTGQHPVDQLWVANYAPVNNYQRIMMKFDISSLAGQNINKAELNIYRFFGCPSGGATTVRIYAIQENWDENSWSPETHISYDADNQYGLYAFSANGMHSIDITSLARAWADSSVVNHGLVMIADDNCKFAKCYSKEASNSEFQPYLEIDYTSPTNVKTEDHDPILKTLELSAYPNPFNPSTNIKIALKKGSKIHIKAYNLAGRQVSEIFSGYLASGNYTYSFKGDNLAAGAYFIIAATEETQQCYKILLMK